MAFTKTLYTTWPSIPDSATDTTTEWKKLVSADTLQLWHPKCKEFVDAGKMEAIRSTVVAPQTMTRKFLDQAAVDEWVSWVQSRADADGVTVIFKILNS